MRCRLADQRPPTPFAAGYFGVGAECVGDRRQGGGEVRRADLAPRGARPVCLAQAVIVGRSLRNGCAICAQAGGGSRQAFRRYSRFCRIAMELGDRTHFPLAQAAPSSGARL